MFQKLEPLFAANTKLFEAITKGADAINKLVLSGEVEEVRDLVVAPEELETSEEYLNDTREIDYSKVADVELPPPLASSKFAQNPELLKSLNRGGKRKFDQLIGWSSSDRAFDESSGDLDMRFGSKGYDDEEYRKSDDRFMNSFDTDFRQFGRKDDDWNDEGEARTLNTSVPPPGKMAHLGMDAMMAPPPHMMPPPFGNGPPPGFPPNFRPPNGNFGPNFRGPMGPFVGQGPPPWVGPPPNFRPGGPNNQMNFDRPPGPFGPGFRPPNVGPNPGQFGPFGKGPPPNWNMNRPQNDSNRFNNRGRSGDNSRGRGRDY